MKKDPVKTVLFPIQSSSEDNPLVSPLPVIDEKTPPSDNNSDSEFLLLEAQLASAKKPPKNNVTSPMTSVCALLENTKITRQEKKTNSIIDQINNLLKQDEEQFEQYKKQREVRVREIMALVRSIEEDKENGNRRSDRIAAKTSPKKCKTSPAVTKSVDLRRAILNKNLSKNIQYTSPTKKAMEMYNNMRIECSFLCTPKLSRTNVSDPQSVTKRLSMKIQNQCLALQDTPRPGKSNF